MMAIQGATQTAIQAVRDALRSAPPKAKRKKLQDALRELRSDMLKARAAGYTHAEISELFERAGVHASAAAIERALRAKRGSTRASTPAAKAQPEGITSGALVIPEWQRP